MAIPTCEQAVSDFPDINRFKFQLARALDKGERYQEAAQYYEPLATSGYAPAAYNLADLYFSGAGVAKNPKRAVALLEVAAQNGFPLSQYQLGNLYATGEYVAPDLTAAAEWYERAPAQGDDSARLELGKMYRDGLGVGRDYQKALELFRSAAEQGNALALTNIGWMHENGLGVTKDGVKAYVWYRLAIEAGNDSALLLLARLIAKGEVRLSDDVNRKVDISRRVLRYGRHRQKLLLTISPVVGKELRGRLVKLAISVDRDAEWDRAFEDFADAAVIAEDEFLTKHRQLALAGLRLTEDSALVEAVSLYEKATAAGSVEAMLALAALNIEEYLPAQPHFHLSQRVYRKDASPPERFFGSVRKAAELYDVAAKSGSSAAKINLGVLYEIGRGVDRDLQAASRMYNRAIGTRHDLPAQLGLLRLEFDKLWREETSRRAKLLRLEQDDARARVDDVFVIGKHFVEVELRDPEGRRLFAGILNKGQRYRVPRSRNDLVLRWSDTRRDGLEVRLGSKIVFSISDDWVPPDRRYLRLDRRYLGADRPNPPRTEPEGDDYREVRPPMSGDVLRKSRVAIQAITDSDFYVHDENHLIGFRPDLGRLYQGERMRLPDRDDLTLEFIGRTDGTKAQSAIAIFVDGDKVLQLSAPPDCMMMVRLLADDLRTAKAVGDTPATCEQIAESDSPCFVGKDKDQIVCYRKLPFKEFPLNGGRGGRRTWFLRFEVNGLNDELYRAAKWLHLFDLRDYGPNSFDSIESAVEVSKWETRLGLLGLARDKLMMANDSLRELGSAPPGLTIHVISQLARTLVGLGRYSEAEEFALRALALRERQNEQEGRMLPERSELLWNLSEINKHLGFSDKAIMYLLQAHLLTQMREPELSDSYNKKVGPRTLVSLLSLLRATSRRAQFAGLLPYAHQEAKENAKFVPEAPEPFDFPLYLRWVERNFTFLSPSGVDRSHRIADWMGSLGQVYSWMGRHGEALPLLQQQAKTFGNIYGAGHPLASAALAQVAEEHRMLGGAEEALTTAQRAFAVAASFVGAHQSVQQAAIAGANAVKAAAFALLEALHAQLGEDDKSGAAQEAFQVAQRLQSSSAALALQAFGARLSQSDPRSRDFVRRRQDLQEELARLDVMLVSAVRSNDAKRQEEVKRNIDKTEGELRALSAHRPAEVEEFDELAQVSAVPYEALKTLLKADEALVTFVSSDEATFAFVGSRDSLRWARIDLNDYALERMVKTLRCGLDAQQWVVGTDQREKCLEATKSSPRVGVLPFDTGVAHELYRALLGPFADTIRDKRLIMALSGPLASLPPQVLVTEPTAKSISTKLTDYEGVAWLARRHPITVLPSVGSLASLRASPKSEQKVSVRDRAQEPYIGLGNPRLSGNPRCAQARVPNSCSQLVRQAAVRDPRRVSTRSPSPDSTYNYFQRSLANVERVRQECPLPETARELSCVAQSVGAKSKSLVLGPDFSETTVKRLPLDRYRIIHFATHGLLADDAQRLAGSDAEPALVMTPPDKPTPEDDGLLTVSEIAQLKLNADWVVLSACNTAGGDRVGSDALGGLARAFFYAGARTLLASHWAVDSGATVYLTTRAFAAVANSKEIGPAEALRRSMLAMMNEPALAHPQIWAPFVVIGEGGATAAARAKSSPARH